MSELEYIYEAVDHTSDEMYHTLGVWRDLHTAIQFIRSFKDDPSGLDTYGFVEDRFEVRIWRRPIDTMKPNGFPAVVFMWDIDFEDDDLPWKMKQIKASGAWAAS